MAERVEQEERRILHLEDDPLDRELIREVLEADGIGLRVVQVDTREEFQSALAHEGVELVLSDFALPRFDGFSALEIVQGQKPDLPFIFVSGTLGEDAAIESLRRGATDYVLKGRLSRLGPAVRRALEEVSVRRTRKEATESAANRQQFLKAMLESLDAGVMACDADGVLTTFNRAARDILGLAEAAIRPEQWAKHYGMHRPDGKHLFETEALPLYRALRGERVRDVEVLIRRGDGQARSVLVSGQPILGVRGESLGAVAALHDITDRKHLEGQLRQAQKLEAIGSLAGGVAHDFNNLLTVIGGYSQIVMDQMGRENPQYARIEEISKAAERAAALTRQLLAFSRKQVLEPRVLDLNAIVSDMERMLRRLLPANIELVTALSGDPQGIKADQGQIEQVLLNLVVNARDAMEQGGRLVIETRRSRAGEYSSPEGSAAEAAHVLLIVRDSGSGMSAETQARIFEPFFTTKEIGKGTGLGLSTVYGIVRQSGGGMEVSSEVGVGTTFRIYLPATERAPERKVPDAPAGSQARGTETILVVDDDDRVRMLVQRILEGAGYKVVPVADGREALRVFEADPGLIRLVLTDRMMPGMSGPELLSRIREKRSGCKGIYMSGYSEKNLPGDTFSLSDVPHIQKPFSPAALTECVRDVLDRPSPSSATGRKGS